MLKARSYVGRVGGLAFALGVGAAVSGGMATAWADDGSAATASCARSERSSHSAGTVGQRPHAAAAARVAGRAPSAAAAAVKPTAASAELPARVVNGVAPTTANRPERVAAAAVLNQPLILGPSGVPIPSPSYVDEAMSFYITPNTPGGTAPPQAVFTPEGLYPVTGIKELPIDTSIEQGLTIMSNTLAQLPSGTPTTVFGWSQSAVMSGLLQRGNIQPLSNMYPAPAIPDGLKDSISFILVGNEMNPNGGFLSRFPGLKSFPSIGLQFYGPMPEDAYPTTNYTSEYDGFADFPRYPLNFLSVLNAALGIVYVHTKYLPDPGCTSFCMTQQRVQDAMRLPVSEGSTAQNYFFIPTENLPLLQPLRALPLIGNPLADLIQPVLKVIVDLGYADPAHGFTTAVQPLANVGLGFGLFPEVSPMEVLSRLGTAVIKGISDFMAAFAPGGSITRELGTFTQPSSSSDGPINSLQQVITSVANGISTTLSTLYAPLLPTADILNALLIPLPAYNLNLALDGVNQILTGDLIGGLINTIGRPLAADVGLVTVSSMVGALVWANAIASIFGVKIG